MELVEPIRSKEKIEEMKETLAYTKDSATDKQKLEAKRNRFLFVFGINVGLRISDIVRLKISDLLDDDGNIKEHLELKEQKTNKNKKTRINIGLSKESISYIKELLRVKYKINYDKIKTSQEERKKYDDIREKAYIFFSNKGDNLTRVQAYRLLNGAAKKCHIDNFGTHTLRKTFGYWHYKQDGDVVVLMELFNHSSPSVTLRYIGMNQDMLDKKMDNFFL